MKYTSIESVTQNDRLGKNIYASDGRILLKKGTPLTIGLISRLNRLGVDSVYLMNEQDENVEIKESISEQTKSEVIRTLTECHDMVQSGKDFHVKVISQTTNHLIDDLLSNKDITLQLEEIRTKDNRLLIHSLHVTMISILIGIKLGLNNHELRNLGTGALLHDIGKVAIKVNEDDQEPEKHHAWRGFNILRQNRELSTLSAHVAFQHHEYIDGSGAPRGIKGDDIHPYAKIVAVANYYDNLTAPIDDSQPLIPYEACEKLLALTGKYFDHKVVWQFLRAVAIYPTGSTVRLSNGKLGTVVAQNKGLPQRPIIKLFTDNMTSKFDQYDIDEINLAKQTTTFIKQVIQE